MLTSGPALDRPMLSGLTLTCEWAEEALLSPPRRGLRLDTKERKRLQRADSCALENIFMHVVHIMHIVPRAVRAESKIDQSVPKRSSEDSLGTVGA
jgi:hypothetical protein